MSDEDRRAAQIAGLRELADWLEAHPGVPLSPHASPCVIEFAAHFGDVTPGAMARAMGGRVEKDSVGDQYFTLSRRFAGGVRYDLHYNREAVCERVVVRSETVEVEGPDPDVVAALPTVKRTETREVVEWRCPESLLAGDAR